MLQFRIWEWVKSAAGCCVSQPRHINSFSNNRLFVVYFRIVFCFACTWAYVCLYVWQLAVIVGRYATTGQRFNCRLLFEKSCFFAFAFFTLWYYFVFVLVFVFVGFRRASDWPPHCILCYTGGCLKSVGQFVATNRQRAMVLHATLRQAARRLAC